MSRVRSKARVHEFTFFSMEIMITTSQELEQGYEKIANWCSLEFRRLGRDAQLEVGSIMREAIRWLRKRSELLKYVFVSLVVTQSEVLSCSQ